VIGRAGTDRLDRRYSAPVPGSTDRTPLSPLLAASLSTAIAAAAVHAQSIPTDPASADAPAPQADRSSRARPIDGRSLGGFLLPIKPIEARSSFAATRGWRWKVDDTQRLLLEGDVRIAIGGYAFDARRAAVWINRVPVGAGAVTQIAAWIEAAEEPARRTGLGASGRDILVTASTTGPIELSLVLTEDGRPDRAAVSVSGSRRAQEEAAASRRTALAAAESRLARHLRELAARTARGEQPLLVQPSVDAQATHAAPPRPQPGGPIVSAPDPSAAMAARPETVRVERARPVSIFEPKGTVSFSADEVAVEERANRITARGLVQVEYAAASDGSERTLQLMADSGVIFLAEGATAALREGGRALQASDITGIYLEGAVQASDGEYSIRASRIYYDLAANRAVIADAVLRTYDRRRGDMPVSVRAEELRQVAADEWTATRATVSTSEFFTPHLAIGVDRVTVTMEPPSAGGGVFVNAEGAGLEAGGARILPLPGYEGRVDRIPVRSLGVGFDEERGVEVETRWDLAALLGDAPTPGLDAALLVDGFSDRGAAVGAEFSLSESYGDGAFLLYGLADSGGDDRTSSGRTVEQEQAFRGIVDGAWRMAIDETLDLRTQFAYISDETFVTSWRDADFQQRREYESSVELVRTNANTWSAIRAKHDLNDFISNSYLLASRGYTVDKLPELAIERFGDEPAQGWTWSQEWSAAAVALRPTTGTPALLGVPTGAWGGAIADDAAIDAAYRDAGYTDGTVGRLHTRHEISVPLASDWVTVAPFVRGAATGYLSDELEAYTPGVDSVRLEAGGGVRASMRFMSRDDRVQSRLLDLNRIRHIVEPYLTVWSGWDSVDAGALPIYDQSIEGSTEGSAVNIGLRQTLQTQRGGAGAWRSVDWLKLDLGLVASDEADELAAKPVDPLDPLSSLRWTQSPLPAFRSFKPELSQWGSHFYGASTWQLSDALTFGGTVNYLLEDSEFVTDEGSALPNLARGSLGVEMRHSPVVSTYAEYRYLAPTDTELLQTGVLYAVGPRYMLSASPQYDLDAGEFRAVSGGLNRTFPDFDLNLSGGYDLIEDRAFVSMSLSIPAGSGRARVDQAYGSSYGGRR